MLVSKAIAVWHFGIFLVMSMGIVDVSVVVDQVRADYYTKQVGALLEAAERGSLADVQLLVESGADVNRTNSRGQTPLHLAAKHGHLDIVRYLVPCEADVNKQDYVKTTPVMEAAGIGGLTRSVIRESRVEMVRYLVSRGADIKAINQEKMSVLHAASVCGDIPTIQYLVECGKDFDAAAISAETAMLHAAYARKWGAVRVLIEAGVNVNTGEHGDTMLMFAVRDEDIDAVQYLLGRGADVHAINSSRRSILCEAIASKNLELVHLVVEHGADVNMAGLCEAPLISAVRSVCEVIVHYLLDNGADVDARGLEGCSALMIALNHKAESIARLLVDYGANVNAVDVLQNSVLQAATRNSSMDTLQYLLDRGAKIERMAWQDRTLMIEAVKSRKIETVQCLLDHGADVNEADISGKTALLYATPHGSLEMVQCLVNGGADINLVAGRDIAVIQAAIKKHDDVFWYLVRAGADLEVMNESGNTMLCRAALNGWIEVIQYLVDAGADVNNPNERGRTPLILAASRLRVNAVDSLINNGADVNAVCSLKRSALAYALMRKNGNRKIVERLVAAGANVNAVDGDGITPLHRATRHCVEDCMLFLLDHGAEMNARTNEGETALLIAVKRKALKMTNHLINRGADPSVGKLDDATVLELVKNDALREALSAAMANR